GPGREVEEAVLGEGGACGLDPVEDDEELAGTAQVEELARHLARFARAVAFCEIGRGIGVGVRVLERHDVAALHGPAARPVDVGDEPAVVLVALGPAEELVRVVDRDDIVDERAAGVAVVVVMTLAALPGDEVALLADQEMSLVVAGVAGVERT